MSIGTISVEVQAFRLLLSSNRLRFSKSIDPVVSTARLLAQSAPRERFRPTISAAREEFEVESLLRWPTASQLTYTRRVICIEETTRNITRLGVCIRTSARIRLASQPAASANSEGSREIYGTNPVWRLRSGEVESRTPRSSASSVTSRRGVASTLPRAIYDERRSCSEQGTADIGGNRFIR